MAWFCNEIIAQPSARLFDALREVDEFAEHIFFVEAVPGAKPNFPPGGLVFVRDVGEPGAFNTKRSWLAVPERRSPELAISPGLPKVITMGGEEHALSPPERFLRFLKWLSAESDSVVAYYSAFSWGGQLEREYAWTFNPWEMVFCDAGQGQIRIFQENDVPWQGPGDVLVSTLERLGIESPEWNFHPHDRSFSWDRYRM